MTVRVLMDACLLVKGNVSNVMLDLSDAGLIELHWTDEIEYETAKNWTRIQLSKDASDREKAGVILPHTDQDIETKLNAAWNRLEYFHTLVPEWRVPGWNLIRCARRLLPQLLSAEVSLPIITPKMKVDPKDVHVALAAMELARVFTEDEVWLATDNINDLPPEILNRVKVDVMIPGILIESLYQKNGLAVVSALEKTMFDSKKPKIDQLSMIRIMQAENQFGSTVMASELRRIWGL